MRLTRQTLAFVLAGGRGSRLMELTEARAKPGLPFGSRHRIIDFTLANCVNSDIRRIAVLTQYKAQNLIQHLQDHWTLERDFGEFVNVAPAQQRTGSGRYACAAEAVHQNLDHLDRHRPALVLILGGDHVQKTDYGPMLAEHLASGADVSVACIDAPIGQAGAFGVLEVDDEDRVVGWEEKPASPKPLPGSSDRAPASMGLYVFDAATLVRSLALDTADPASSHDFGHTLLPALLRTGRRVHAWSFNRRGALAPGRAPNWRDVGTPDACWQANIELMQREGGCDLLDRRWPMPAAGDSGRPTRFVIADGGAPAVVSDSLLGTGWRIGTAMVHRSVLCPATSGSTTARASSSRWRLRRRNPWPAHRIGGCRRAPGRLARTRTRSTAPPAPGRRTDRPRQAVWRPSGHGVPDPLSDGVRACPACAAAFAGACSVRGRWQRCFRRGPTARSGYAPIPDD